MTGAPPQLHPLYQARVGLLAGIPGPGLIPVPEHEEARHAFQAPFGEPKLPVVEVSDELIPGPNGPVPVRRYQKPTLATPTVGLIWMHGGAFMYGDLDTPEADHFAREMAHRANAVVVSVDYRLCDGQVTFPVPHDDCYAAYTWVRQHATQWGIDAARLAVGGGSAGGNLAASVALHGAEAGQKPWQMLLAYPLLHPELPEMSAELQEALTQVPVAVRYTRENSRPINDYVLGRPASTATPYDFPGLAADFAAFPPAYIENSEFDDLRASGEAFGADLAAAGVSVEQMTARGVPHGHLNAVGSPMLEDSYDRFATRLAGGPNE